jgi:hypothetical protein
MIRLSASASDHGFTFTLAREGALILTTADRNEVAAQLLALEVGAPGPLIDAAEHWGIVEVREEFNPDWRGG